MSDIIIAVICFPNDPTQNRTAHQMFVAQQTDTYIDLYSVSSILGKEKRVYGKEKDNYITIIHPEHAENNFKVPSFIDCAKVYRVSVGKTIDLSRLSHRSISKALRKRIEERIGLLQNAGKQTVYTISEDAFRNWNPKL